MKLHSVIAARNIAAVALFSSTPQFMLRVKSKRNVFGGVDSIALLCCARWNRICPGPRVAPGRRSRCDHRRLPANLSVRRQFPGPENTVSLVGTAPEQAAPGFLSGCGTSIGHQI